MGYTLKAYIGKDENLNPILEKYSEAKKVNLNGGISMIPMTDELFDEINDLKFSSAISAFEFLTENIEKEIIQIIEKREIAYVESEIFGGEGGHIGIIWNSGKRDLLTELGKSSMNIILKKLGVNKSHLKDEFDTVGLAQNRHTEDWIE